MATAHEHTCFDCKEYYMYVHVHVFYIRRRYTLYTMICYVHLYSGLSSLLNVASKHDGSDSTALPNENGQLGVGLLQINIVASNKLNSLYTKKTH